MILFGYSKNTLMPLTDRHYHIMKWNHISTDLWWRSFFRLRLNRKPTNLAAKTFFFFLFWNSHISGPKTHYFDGYDFFFGLHLFLERKGVTPRNSAPGSTIPSKATDLVR